ncbi:glycosyltransferase family 2 protein [Hyphomicrobium sp. 99]|uniref:glycosyltransferase family 2 protein n=1 Tax=Hyphomicrobium sp. 99 TaxID=1163419 RepID=UPI0005F783E3|nr:glycosyltransferase family A protein [Hyphomicrobium sp. 99]
MANDEQPRVFLTLLVCTLGRVEPLERLLSSLTAQTLKNFEVIIVDQNPEGSLDPTIQKFPELRIKHLRSRPGLSRARNIGLSASSGRYVGFPDDDVWYRPTVVEEVFDTFRRNPKLSAITGRLIDPEGHPVTVYLPGEAQITRENIFEAANSNTIFIECALAQSLRFDEGLGLGAASEFQSGEETDFLLRALERGVAGWYFPELTIFHDAVDNGTPFAERARRATAYARGFGYVIRRHRYPPSYILGKIARTSLRGALCVATGDLDGARLRLAWTNGVLYGYSKGKPKLPVAAERIHGKKK